MKPPQDGHDYDLLFDDAHGNTHCLTNPGPLFPLERGTPANQWSLTPTGQRFGLLLQASPFWEALNSALGSTHVDELPEDYVHRLMTVFEEIKRLADLSMWKSQPTDEVVTAVSRFMQADHGGLKDRMLGRQRVATSLRGLPTLATGWVHCPECSRVIGLWQHHRNFDPSVLCSLWVNDHSRSGQKLGPLETVKNEQSWGAFVLVGREPPHPVVHEMQLLHPDCFDAESGRLTDARWAGLEKVPTNGRCRNHGPQSIDWLSEMQQLLLPAP